MAESNLTSMINGLPTFALEYNDDPGVSYMFPKENRYVDRRDALEYSVNPKFWYPTLNPYVKGRLEEITLDEFSGITSGETPSEYQIRILGNPKDAKIEELEARNTELEKDNTELIDSNIALEEEIEKLKAKLAKKVKKT